MADDEPTFFEQLQSLPGAAPEPTSTEPSIIDRIGAFAEEHAPVPPTPDAEPNLSAHAVPDADPQAILDDISAFAHANSPANAAKLQDFTETMAKVSDPWREDAIHEEPELVDEDTAKNAIADGAHDVAAKLWDAGFDEGEFTSVGLMNVANAIDRVAYTRDRDHDGLDDGEEMDRRTNPMNPDTDGDRISDGMEVHGYRSNPLSTDSDHDGRSDTEEAAEAGVLYDLQGNVVDRVYTDALVTPHGTTPAARSAGPAPEAGTPGPVTSPREVDPTLSAAVGDDVTGASSILPEEPPAAAGDPWGEAAPEAPIGDVGAPADDPWAAAQVAATADVDPGFDAPAAAEQAPEIFVPDEPSGDFAAAEDAPADAVEDLDGGAIDEGF